MVDPINMKTNIVKPIHPQSADITASMRWHEKEVHARGYARDTLFTASIRPENPQIVLLDYAGR